MERPTVDRPSTPRVLVGLGASAGGITALEAFFAAMPADGGGAFVVILHLSPGHVSAIAGILGRRTAMPVVEAVDGQRVRADHVYVIPPNRTMTLAGGTLKLEAPSESRARYTPIDRFFSSLAEDQDRRAVGIVLSGTGSDGTLGLKAIKSAGGLTMAQDPATAEQPGMPRSAIELRVVDHVLAVEDMPTQIRGYTRHTYTGGHDGTAAAEDEDAAEFGEVLAMLQARTKIDFHGYRAGTVRRRILRRMGVRHVDSLAEYVRALHGDPEEVERLAGDMLINVTGFFREPAAWRALDELVLRPLVAGKSEDEAIRIWVPACASGEEAYTLAIVLLRQLEQARKRSPVQIFATDVDRASLEIARTGLYPESAAAELDPEDFHRCFVREGDRIRVAKRLRDVVVFANQNVLADPPYSKLDLISCRNLLIYLEPDRQKKILSLFHFGLRDGGFLFLGTSEGAGHPSDLFSTVSRKWKIYRRTGAPRQAQFEIAAASTPSGSRRSPGASADRGVDQEIRHAEQAVLQRYAPASILIDGQFQLRYLFGPTGGVLRQPQGRVTSDLFEWLPKTMRSKIRAAVLKAWRADTGPETVLVRSGTDDAPAWKVTIERLADPEEPDGLTLLVLQETSPASETVLPTSEPENAVMLRLEEELRETRGELETMIAELQVSNEELRAVNEEAQSINEELQSANEELETSKEELQTLNEELLAVNYQLQTKLTELEQRNDDLDNLLHSTDLAVIFLDRDLRIKWFSPAMTGMFHLLHSDLGRPLRDLAARFTDPDLLVEAEKVLERHREVTREIRTHEGRWFLRRVLPYRTRGEQVEGVVITLSDVHALRLAEIALKERAEGLERRVDDRTALLLLQQDVASAANEALGVEEAVGAALRLICTHTSWSVGHAWDVRHPSGEAIPTGIWHVPAGRDYSAFMAATMSATLESGDGIIGRTVETGEPQWISDVAPTRFVRGDLTTFGLRSAATVPVVVRERVVMVLELFSTELGSEPSPRLLATLANVGIQVGHVIDRRALEKVVADQIERERQTVGDELHDSVGQTLAALALATRATLARTEERDPSVAEEFMPIYQGVEAAKQELRRIIRGILPPQLDGFGLASAVVDLAESVETRHAKRCRVVCDDPVTLDPGDGFVGAQLYRIAQEAVRNAIAHAEASEIDIALRGDGDLVLEVRDNGNGNWAKGRERGRGVSIMRYRADLIGGRFYVDVAPGQGTTVRCIIPRHPRFRRQPAAGS